MGSELNLCPRSECPRRDECYRAMARPSGQMQDYTIFYDGPLEYHGGCAFFILASKSVVKRLDAQRADKGERC
jgi:hypothetical protein